MSDNNAILNRTDKAADNAAAALHHFESFKFAIVTFTAIEGETPGTYDGVIDQANVQFAHAVGRRHSKLAGMRFVGDLGIDSLEPVISSCKIAGELNDVVKTSVEITTRGRHHVFDANCRAVGNTYCAVLVDVTDFVMANRSQDCRIGELIFVNDALEAQASELAQLAEQIEASRQSLDIEVERRIKLEAELRRMAHFDELTGIANRRSFLADSYKILDGRSVDESCALILLDIDYFKTINDSYGHIAGDEVLRQVAGLVTREVGDLGTLFGRIGGEEFALLMPHAGITEAQGFAEWIRSRICETSFIFDKTHINITVSLGVTESLPGENNLTAVIARADSALYAAKAAGRNNVQLVRS